MNKTIQQQIEDTFQRKCNFHPSDPRESDPCHVDNWDHTHEWFPWKKYYVNDNETVIIWVDCGYGNYAMERQGKLLGIGKDSIQADGLIFLGEYYGDPTLSVVCKEVAL